MENLVSGNMKLFKSIKVDDKDVKELEYDFNNMPSNAISKAQTFLAERKYGVGVPQSDVELHNLLFGIAAGLAFEDAYRLHPKDKMNGASKSMYFFNSDSEDSSQEMK